MKYLSILIVLLAQQAFAGGTGGFSNNYDLCSVFTGDNTKIQKAYSISLNANDLEALLGEKIKVIASGKSFDQHVAFLLASDLATDEADAKQKVIDQRRQRISYTVRFTGCPDGSDQAMTGRLGRINQDTISEEQMVQLETVFQDVSADSYIVKVDRQSQQILVSSAIASMRFNLNNSNPVDLALGVKTNIGDVIVSIGPGQVEKQISLLPEPHLLSSALQE
ncbi:MAG: hypothetical protein HRT44_03745 [Bdellovibrionales bacterium]|nr:hypothetical protein [Bdellovibrionales bacterium]NQZ18357.1 hypothetical protein [Bdellovibrionales bacterium]